MPLFRTAPWIMIALLYSSCAKPLKETRLAPGSPGFSLVIASNKTDFKKSILEKLIARYRSRANIDLVRINGISRVNADNYDAVLIMDSCMAWTMFNPALKAFLRKAKDKGKVVLFITAADRGWHYRYRGVDAITSASTQDRGESAFVVLSKKIDQILERQDRLPR